MFSAFFRSLKQEFAGYNSKKLLADMMAGLTVCAVALPLALAFGVSSGASAASGLVTAIIAGVVIAILGGASYQISGPTGAMSAVLVGIVAEYGLQGVFFACFAAGVLLLLAGVFKLGRLISFIPMPVIMGFTSGIAIIIAMGQIDNFFGTVSEGGSNLEKIASYGRLGFHPNMQAVLIGLLVVECAHLLAAGGGKRCDPLVEQRFLRRFVLCGLVKGGDIAREALAEVVDEAHARHLVHVGLGKFIAQEKRHQCDAPAVLGNALVPPAGGVAVAGGVLQFFRRVQRGEQFAWSHASPPLSFSGILPEAETTCKEKKEERFPFPAAYDIMNARKFGAR